VCFKPCAGRLEGGLINDSKKMSAKNREKAAEIIKENAYFAVASASLEEIERLNILGASLLAMKRAVNEVAAGMEPVENLHILVDGNKKIPDLGLNQQTIKGGDGKSAAIAAASILAKVARDEYMMGLHKKFPQYSWAKNKGYLTKEHAGAIKKYGVTEFHRKSFLKNIISLECGE
jgi:ribonuclease HII